MIKTLFFQNLLRRSDILASTVIALLITYVFRLTTRVCPTINQCYSSLIDYPLQIDSIFKGTIAITDVPNRISHDWTWSIDQANQPWGLGVPILRIPFELILRAFGSKYFPDGAILLFYHFILSYYASSLLLKIFKTLNIDRWKYSIATIFIQFLFLLSGPYIHLINFNYSTYHQAVAYNYLYSMFLLLVFINLVVIPSGNKSFYLFCILSGFSPWFRLTGLIYGATFLSAYVVYVRIFKRKKEFFIGIALFILPIALLLALNKLRFGSLWEFGYSINISNIPLNDYSLRFTYPFKEANLIEASKELLSAIFFVVDFSDVHSFYARFLEYQVPIIRFREFMFPTYDFFNLTFSVGGLIATLILTIKFAIVRFKAKELPTFTEKLILLLAITGFTSTFLLFGFYLYSPSITSRYMIDFLLGINILSLICIVTTIRVLNYLCLVTENALRR